MEITLRNGENIQLNWNSLILEYLEEYEGGIKQLKKDVESTNCRFRAFNFIIYCIMSISYSEELGYKEAVSLVDINDIEKIVDFIVENMNNIKLSNQKNNRNIVSKRPHRR